MIMLSVCDAVQYDQQRNVSYNGINDDKETADVVLTELLGDISRMT